MDDINLESAAAPVVTAPDDTLMNFAETAAEFVNAIVPASSSESTSWWQDAAREETTPSLDVDNPSGGPADSTTAKAADAAKATTSSSSPFAWLRRMLGIEDSGDRKADAATTGLLGSVIAGAGAGYGAYKKHQIDKRNASTQESLAAVRAQEAAANVALANANTEKLNTQRENQAAIASLAYKKGSGLIDGFKPAKLVPVQTRGLPA